MKFIRKNGWSHKGMLPFDESKGNFRNEANYWYAVGIHFLQQKHINEPDSWWFYAALHGEYVSQDSVKLNDDKYLNWKKLEYIKDKSVLEILPSIGIQVTYWNQCQHSSSYFAPWHRGYLVSLEDVLRKIIIENEGPEDWGLPYWDVVAHNDDIPFDFIKEAVFKINGQSFKNPLYVEERYTGQGNDSKKQLNNECLKKNVYTVESTFDDDGKQIVNDFGGKNMGYQHFGSGAGALEKNPHNHGHNYIGGSIIVSEECKEVKDNNVKKDSKQENIMKEGLMSDPNTAGLDPIFYLHHCNIDRLWASWNKCGYTNPSEKEWMDGPASVAQRDFYMPNPKGWKFTPADVNDIGNINLKGEQYSYDYDNYENVEKDTTTSGIQLNEKSKISPILLVATESIHLFNGKKYQPNFIINKNEILKAAITHNNRYFILLEGVKGNFNNNSINVYVGDELIESLSLFGLKTATLETSHHGGSGLTFSVEITKLLKSINDLDNLLSSVRIDLDGNLSGKSLSIDRISIYKL